MNLIDRVAHRLKLRDLRLLDVVVRSRSMAKASAQLNLTQPAVSKAIAELEHTLGVRLLDRSRQGIEPTAQGAALLRRGAAIFDELRQGVSEIESLSDPTAGEVRILTSEPIAAGLLPTLIARLARRYPQIAIHATQSPIASLQHRVPQYRELRDREVDLVLGPIISPFAESDLVIEPLFEDPPIVVAGGRNQWARRRTLALEELMEESWCLPPADTVAGARCAEIFRASGLGLPRKKVISVSVQLQIGLLATQRFLSIVPSSLMAFSAKRFALKTLPIKSPLEPRTVGIVTLKNRTISPVVQLFIRTAREVATVMK